MIERIREALENFTLLGPREIYRIASVSTFKSFKKGDCIIQTGELNYNGILVVKGLLKSIVINEDGEERIILFIPEKKYAGSSHTILRNKPSIETIIAIEDSIVIMFDDRRLWKLAKDSPSILLLHNKKMKELLAEAIDQVWFHLVLTPEQRYHRFLKEFPLLEQRITQKDLASYLGITATSLSRMRARIAKS